MRRVWLLPWVLLGACREAPAPASEAPVPAWVPAAPTSAPAPPPATVPVQDDRTAADFAQAWVGILQLTDEDARYKAADTFGPTWQGRRFTWTGLALPSLCSEKRSPRTPCALQVFSADLPERGRLGGSMPLVTFAEPPWSTLKAACAGQAGCVVRFEGLLSEARTDPDQAVRLLFTDARVLEARPPTPHERWFRPPPVAPGSFAGSLRTADPVAPPTLAPEVY